MSSPRQLLKSAIEEIIGAPIVVRAALARLRGARLILSYHNVIATNAPLSVGDGSLHLPLSNFRAQLDAITASGLPVVPLDAPVDPKGRPAVVITFDDAYAGTLDVALPELTARALPSTIFVAPGLLGSAAPWWDRLATPLDRAVPASIREVALDELAGEEERILAAAASRGWTIHEPIPEHRIASEAELTASLAHHPLLTLGAHTWGHPNVSRLGADVLEREMRTPRAWLRARFGDRYVDWLAYPYGLTSGAARRAAAEAGYRDAVLVAGGWSHPRAPTHARPRLNVTPGISGPGFRARLGGLL